LIFRGLNFESNEELGQKCHLWLDTSLGAEKSEYGWKSGSKLFRASSMRIV